MDKDVHDILHRPGILSNRNELALSQMELLKKLHIRCLKDSGLGVFQGFTDKLEIWEVAVNYGVYQNIHQIIGAGAADPAGGSPVFFEVRVLFLPINISLLYPDYRERVGDTSGVNRTVGEGYFDSLLVETDLDFLHDAVPNIDIVRLLEPAAEKKGDTRIGKFPE